MKLHPILLLSFLVWSLASCDSIDEADRYEGPLQLEVKKNVLIEDFTGQLCLNCPLAAEAIGNMQKTYGNEHIIAVALHGGDLSIDAPYGLATEESKAYHTYWKVDTWPKGVVDRSGGTLEYTSWSAKAVERLQLEPTLSIDMSGNTYDADSRQLTVRVAIDGTLPGGSHLQVWLTESNITALQRMPNGEYNAEYVHNHVLRQCVNGQWGEPIASTGEVVYSDISLPADWKAEDMAVVAFVYNDEGVAQVIDVPVVQ